MRTWLTRHRRFIAILSPAILGAIFMCICILIVHRTIRLDEAYGAYLTHFDFRQIWQFAAANAQPPLYYFLLKIWVHIFGHADFVLRFLSIFCGAVSIMLIYMWAKYKLGLRAAIIISLIFSVSPIFVYLGCSANCFMLAAAIFFASTFSLQLAIDNKRKVWWAAYIIATILGVLVSYYFIVAILAQLIYYNLARKKHLLVFHLPQLAATIIAAILIVVSIIGLGFVRAQANGNYISELYDNLIAANSDQQTPIIANTPELYYKLSVYNTERIFVLDQTVASTSGGFSEPLRHSYFGRISNIDNYDEFWLVDIAPADSGQLDSLQDGFIISETMNLNLSSAGHAYQAAHFVKQ